MDPIARKAFASLGVAFVAASLGTSLVSCATDSGSEGGPPFVFRPIPYSDGGIPGNRDGNCTVPAEAMPDSVTAADRVVGDGTRASCTPAAFRSAVAHGGKIRFDCGPDTMTIVMDAPAKVFNDSLPDIVIDGGGKIALSGAGRTRILYMNTCDPVQHWTTSHCQDQDHPRLTVRNLTFVDGNSESESEFDGGGAIWVRGGRFKIAHCRFFRNVCAKLGPDVGGGAVRVFSQYRNLPVHVVNSTFGEQGEGNVGANGGALSSIGVNWSIWNSLFVGNEAVGNGGNPQDKGTPGGGSGGAIYNDGNTLTLSICGSRFEKNKVNAYGAAIFFVSNNHDGLVRMTDSRVSGNIGGSWHNLPGIAMHPDTRLDTANIVLEHDP
ncbi:MAG TPA: hypothetical protein PK208_04445 [Fibrobacteria bacterium]|nr:hypothetical protein [Fibrobacteria bacterium]